MSWIVRLGGETYSSLDLTLNEIESLETISGQPWALINPLASIRSAKAYLAIFAIREGQAEDVVAKNLESLTLREIHGAFEYVDDEAPIPKGKGGKKGKALDPSGPGRTSGRGSTSGPAGSDGPPT